MNRKIGGHFSARAEGMSDFIEFAKFVKGVGVGVIFLLFLVVGVLDVIKEELRKIRKDLENIRKDLDNRPLLNPFKE